MAFNYYIGRWQWVTEDDQSYWAPPPGTVAMLDLRSLTQMSAPGPTPLGWGFFAIDDTFPAPADSLLISNTLDTAINNTRATNLRTRLGITTLRERRLRAILMELLTERADPTGNVRWRPLLPNTAGQLEIHLAGHSVIASEKYRPAKHRLVVETLRHDYAEIKKADTLRGHYRKVLGAYLEQYGRFGIKAKDISPEGDTPLTPETTINEDWDCADATANINCDLTWTLISGTQGNILSNRARFSVAADTHNESALSSVNHYAEYDWIYDGTTPSSDTGARGGPTARNATGTTSTFYFSQLSHHTTGTWRIGKEVAGAITTFVTTNGTRVTSARVKISIDGSTLTLFVDGVSRATTTDTSITTGTLTGITWVNLVSPTRIMVADNFEAADIVTGVIATGIPSAQALGSPTLTGTIAPSAIASTATIGALSIAGASANVSPSAIPSAQALGTPSISGTISPSGIPSAQALGAPALSFTVTPSSIASQQALGTPSLTATISPSGIPSGAEAGTPALSFTISPPSIPTAQALGTPQLIVTQFLAPSSIPSSQALGTPTISGVISPSGIASVQAVGAQTLSIVIAPSSITSGQGLGAPSVTAAITPAGIPSTQALGAPTLNARITLSGIPSAAVLGSPAVLSPGILAASSIPSSQALGTPSIRATITVAGIPSSQALGSPVLGRTISPASIGPTQALGTPSLRYILLAPSIPSSQAIGAPTINVVATVAGIGSAQALGTPSIVGVVGVVGIPSSEALGTPSLAFFIIMIGIASNAAVGSPAMFVGLLINPGRVIVSDQGVSVSVASDSYLPGLVMTEPGVGVSVGVASDSYLPGLVMTEPNVGKVEVSS